MKNGVLSVFGSLAKKLLRGTMHVSMASLAMFSLSGGANAQNDQYFVDLFFQQGYRYCDARKLSKIYRVSPWEAKILGGRKISLGNLNLLRIDWQKGVDFFQRFGFSCDQGSLTKEQRKFAYNDASRIADAWSRNKSSSWTPMKIRTDPLPGWPKRWPKHPTFTYIRIQRAVTFARPWPPTPALMPIICWLVTARMS